MSPRDLDEALQALASPTRRRILTLVRHQERSAGEIARHFTISRPAISHHLKVLREAGLLTERRDGSRRLLRSNDLRLGKVADSLLDLGDDSTSRSSAGAAD